MLIDGIIMLLKGQLNGTNQSAYTSEMAAVVALTAGRVYENELPRGYELPAICVHQYGGSQDYDFDGPININEDQIQLDSYGADSLSCRQTARAACKLLESYVGTLPDGTIVQGLYKERDMAMPFTAKADQKGIANRWLTGLRVVKQRD